MSASDWITSHPPPGPGPYPGPGPAPPPPTAPTTAQATAPSPAGAAWSLELATRLFAIPVRWGWRAADPPVPATAPPLAPAPEQRPLWVEPPRPDTTQLRQARAAAVTGLVWRVASVVLLAFSFVAYQATIEAGLQQVDAEQGQSTTDIYQVVVLVAGGVLAISLIRALLRLGSASRAIESFERPYRTMRTADRQRYGQALAQWEDAVRRHQAAAAQARLPADGPRWFPVYPASEPTRIDIVGGDPRGHGWASLLVTLGTSVVACRQPITLLDLSGQDVGGGLLSVAQARGLPTRRVDLPGDALDVTLFDAMAAPEIAECLAYALSGRAEAGDQRHERALITEAVQRVIGCLDGAPTFGRIAGGIDVLRQVTPPNVLVAGEVSRLADLVGELGQDEWTARQLRFVASQLRVLDDILLLEGLPPEAMELQPLWAPGSAVSVVATTGLPDDRKELIDRLLVQLAQRALGPGHQQIHGVLAVAGAESLGAVALEALSDHARSRGVRLVLLIDQPQGDLEKTLGTGGAVCIMKMYNHRDATVAADFVGRGYKFVVSQTTLQVGKTFTDGGGDNFSAATTHGSSRKRPRGAAKDLSESRGHTWTGTRNWSLADNLSDSQTSTRVYELAVDPQEILGMPETAFILVDNTGQGRRVVLADANPGICLLDRVALTAGSE